MVLFLIALACFFFVVLHILLLKVGHKSKRAKKRKLDAVRKRSLKQKRKERLGKQIEHLGLIVREVDKEQERQEAADLAKEEKRVQRHSDTRRVGRAKFQVSSREKK